MGEEPRKMNPEDVLKRVEVEGGEVIIRRAQEQDLNGILKILQEWYKEKSPDESVPAQVTERDGRDGRDWNDVISGREPGVALVVEGDGKICGCGIVKKTIKQFSHYADYWVLTTNLSPELRGKGIGQELNESQISETKTLPNAHSLGLAVVKENEDAVRLYEKLGYEKIEGTDGQTTWKGKPAVSFFMVKHF